MNSFTYENNGINTYLVYAVSGDEQVDSMGLGMMTNNKIPGFAQTLFTQKDSNKFIKFNVTSRISLQDFFSGAVNKKRMLGVFKGIVDAFLSAEEYMLDNNAIVLDTNFIFVDVSNCDVNMIMLPILGEVRTSSQICEFFRDLMYSIQTDVSEDCSHVAKIINYLNSSATFSLEGFKRLLNSLDNGYSSGVAAVKPIATIPSAAQVHTVPPVVAAPQQPVVSTPAPAPVPAPAPAPAPAPVPVVAKAPVQTKAPAKPQMNVPPKAPNGMNVPPRPAAAAKPAAPATTPDGKEISLFYLLQHYNSDNAAAYKEQKEAKKAAKAAAQAPKNQAAPAKPAKAKKAPNAPAPQAPVMPQVPVAPVAPVAAVPPVAPVAPVAAPVQASIQQPVVPMAPSGANFGETTVLSGGAAGETTVLSQNSVAAQQAVNPMLVRQKNSEVIRLNKFPFRVGKEKSFVDYFIGDNTAVSRSHAEITSKDGAYFIKDMNSTNHTYVNGTMIQSGVDVPISSGDRLKFANEEFEFKIG